MGTKLRELLSQPHVQLYLMNLVLVGVWVSLRVAITRAILHQESLRCMKGPSFLMILIAAC